LTPEEILKARKLARSGADLTSIAAALNWHCSVRAAQKRLRKYAIRLSAGTRRRADNGDLTYLPAAYQRKTGWPLLGTRETPAANSYRLRRVRTDRVVAMRRHGIISPQ